MIVYTISTAGFNIKADYSSICSLALYAKWQRLLKSADGAMDVDTLINPPFESSEVAWIEETTAAQASSVEVLEGDPDEEISATALTTPM